jgi:GNAT superfamily N-acetyltransferase
MAVTIIGFRDELASYFTELNLLWIRKYFQVEEEDERMLNHPREMIIDKGGYIVFAEEDDEIVGTCALIKIDDETYELAKMATREDRQGKGIGYLVGKAMLDIADRAGASRVILDTNSSLQPAINLYKKLGFVQVPITDEQKARYVRADVMMIYEMT